MDELTTQLNASLTLTSDEITVCTGLQAQCNATGVTQILIPPLVGLEFSVSGMADQHDKTPLDIDITIHEQISRPSWSDFNLTIEQFPVLPLEVVNYYCRTHFDDEDFVYVQFELPPAIQSIISGSGCVDIIAYMRQTLAAMIDGDLVYAPHVIDTHSRIINLYDKVLDYNMTIEAEMEPDAELWPETYLSDVYTVCNTIRRNYNLDMTAPLYKDTQPYYREIYYGLSLIIRQLTMICDYYYNKCGIINPVDFLKHHCERFMRLVNNLCIIMIHNYFMWAQIDFKEDEEAVINTFDSHNPDTVWQLKYPTE